MKRITNSIPIMCLLIAALLYSGCKLNQKKESSSESDVTSTEILARFQQEKNEMLTNAKAELAAINKKIMTCNDKIKQGVKLTDAQNKALDEFEAERASINKRIHEIKNVQLSEWESFKTEFETDLAKASADLEKILIEM